GLLKTRVSKFGEINDTIRFLIEKPAFDAELFINKKNKVTVEKSIEIIEAALEQIERIDDWTLETISETIGAFASSTQLKLGTVMWPLRVGLSGQKVTPGGVNELLWLLGKKNSLSRLHETLDNLKSV
ncbi:MAG: glutamate--tRNA ligase, partial [Selenomonadaceae bacterium]|nr:glutamate--tRNA ligase [Selenomonadaceae bacterium]